MYFLYLMSNNFDDAFNLTAVVTLWLAVKDFCKTSFQNLDVQLSVSAFQCPEMDRNETNRNAVFILKKDDTRQKDEEMFVGLLDSYTKLKKLASNINESFGELFLMYPFFIAFFMQLILVESLVQNDGKTKRCFIIFLLNEQPSWCCLLTSVKR